MTVDDSSRVPATDPAGGDTGPGRQTGTVTDATAIERAVPWVARAAWIAVAWVGGQAIDAAVDGRSDAVRTVAASVGAAAWVVGVATLAVPAVATLTAARVVVPLAIPAAAITWAAGAGATGAAFVAVAVLTTVVVLSGEFGRANVQASAYGDEDRYPLRPPPAYALAAAITWSISAAGLVAGPLFVAAGRPILGAVAIAFALATAVWSWPRWHRLSLRWLVLVPVGLVIHDHLVLAETVMLRRQEITALRLAPAGTGAADFTGPAAGHAVEIEVAAPVTAIRAGTPRDPRGTALHLTACLIAPTRPGRALGAAGARRFPVG